MKNQDIVGALFIYILIVLAGNACTSFTPVKGCANVCGTKGPVSYEDSDRCTCPVYHHNR